MKILSICILFAHVLLGCSNESNHQHVSISFGNDKDTLLAVKLQDEIRPNMGGLASLKFYDNNSNEYWLYKNDTCFVELLYRSNIYPALNDKYDVYLEKVSGDYNLEKVKGEKYYKIITEKKSDLIEFDVYICSKKFSFKSREENDLIFDTLLLFRKVYMVEMSTPVSSRITN